jgi:Arc/MetJ-type ribon-helix-helix transcriptional regulator
MVVKLSVSLPNDDVEFIDEYAKEHGVGSRSAAVHRAVMLLRASELGEAYAAAWATWEATDAELWDATAGDGGSGDAR